MSKLDVDKAVCLILGICVPAILPSLRNWLKSMIRQSQGQKMRLGWVRGVAESDLFLHFASKTALPQVWPDSEVRQKLRS